jgi:hypothetical protein
MKSFRRVLVAGLAGGFALNISMLLTFRLLGFGWNGDGILTTSPLQSQKLISVWTNLEPLPLVVSNPAPIIFGLMLFGCGHAVVYNRLSASCRLTHLRSKRNAQKASLAKKGVKWMRENYF